MGVMPTLCLPRTAHKSDVTENLLLYFKMEPERLLVLMNYLAYGNWECMGECQDCLAEQEF